MLYILSAVYVLLSSSGLILFKLGGRAKAVITFSKGFIDLKLSFLSIAGLLCYLCSFLLYLILVSKFNLSKIYPVTTGLIFICVMLGSVLFVKEQMTVTALIGSVLILTGVIMIVSV